MPVLFSYNLNVTPLTGPAPLAITATTETLTGAPGIDFISLSAWIDGDQEATEILMEGPYTDTYEFVLPTPGAWRIGALADGTTSPANGDVGSGEIGITVTDPDGGGGGGGGGGDDLAILGDAIRARGSACNPVSLRYRDGVLQLWSHRYNEFVDLSDPPTDVTIWRELPFEELPPKAQEYVRLISRIAYTREQGAAGGYLGQLQQEASRLLRELQHEQTSTMRANVANRPDLQYKLQQVRTGGLYAKSRVPIR
jgi:hypothetical protein